MKLSTVFSHVEAIPNKCNKTLVHEFYEYLRDTNKSPTTQKQMLIALTGFARYLGPDKTFYDITKKEEVKAFLDTKIKNPDEDPDRKSITTWNDYRWRIIQFGRWLYNYKLIKEKGNSPAEQNDWNTPNFLKIAEKRTKRLSPYSNNEIWEKEEYLSIIKYEASLRNKAALMLLWDFSARNHEVVSLKIKNITLNERYGEGEVPSESKTGTGPIMLSSSFPYVRDWLNEHPFRNEPNARLICNKLNGAPITPDRLCAVFKELKQRIAKLVASAEMLAHERDRLAILLRTKKWNPYSLYIYINL